ncbi:TlpA family protein disulfide reductase [Chryseobacterium sp. A321]
MNSIIRNFTSLLFILFATLSFAQNTSVGPSADSAAAAKVDTQSTDASEPPAYITPDLKFVDSKESISSLRDLKGKVVFINLWATWCGPCLVEMPTIYKLRQTFKNHEDLVFLMVDVDGKLDKAKAWMDKKEIDLPVYGMASQIPLELFSGSIPTTFIVDKKGRFVGRQVGAANYMDPALIKLINELLEEE